MTAKRKFGWGAALLLLLAACFVYYLVTGMRSAGTISYAQLRQLFQDEKVQEFAISDTRLTAKLRDGSTVSCDLYDFQVFYDDLNDLVVQQNQQGIIKDYTYHADHSTNWLQILLPYVAVILGFILLMNLMARMTGAGPGGAQDRMSHFGDARIQDVPQDSKVSFRDVAGADEEKEELGRSWSSCASRINTWPWGPASPRACCWWALRAPARPCWPRPWPVKQG